MVRCACASVATATPNSRMTAETRNHGFTLTIADLAPDERLICRNRELHCLCLGLCSHTGRGHSNRISHWWQGAIAGQSHGVGAACGVISDVQRRRTCTAALRSEAD